MLKNSVTNYREKNSYINYSQRKNTVLPNGSYIYVYINLQVDSIKYQNNFQFL